ncbi:MAG: dihydrolipoamide acetyltransferase family protein [Lentisphaeria bacterium]|jgi:pyruvate dehydrogenase E2 component (dihydrolipoamide acetyltransferase)|nr:dihydrolipoamide acetyltransferase family protein [Lentisphaeria bacterium]
MPTPIVMPKQGNTVEECLLSEWRVAVGDQVKEGDVIADIETDKTTGEVTATAGGTVLALFCEAGELIPVFQNICVVGNPGESFAEFAPGDSTTPPAAAPAEAPAPAETPAAVPAETAVATTDAPLSPRARTFLADHPTNLTGVAGSGPDGRILEKDVAAAYRAGARLSPAAAAKVAAGEAAPASGSGVAGMVLTGDLGKPAAAAAPAPAPVAAAALGIDTVTEVKIPNIRKIIAKNLMAALHEQAQYTLNAEADVTGLLTLRQQIKDAGERLGLANVNIGDMVMFAAVKALAKHPELNAEFDGSVIRQHSAVHIGFACDTPRGLMVPVLRGAQAMSLGQMGGAVKVLAKEAQAGTLAPDALGGGTFTVSNLGAFGVTTFTPVINPPQVAILGVGKTVLRPVRVGGGIEHRDYMQFSLTLDHRVIDGAPGARFLQTLVAIIENFQLVAIAG